MSLIYGQLMLLWQRWRCPNGLGHETIPVTSRFRYVPLRRLSRDFHHLCSARDKNCLLQVDPAAPRLVVDACIQSHTIRATVEYS
jgi:hypothetical protein